MITIHVHDGCSKALLRPFQQPIHERTPKLSPLWTTVWRGRALTLWPTSQSSQDTQSSIPSCPRGVGGLQKYHSVPSSTAPLVPALNSQAASYCMHRTPQGHNFRLPPNTRTRWRKITFITLPPNDTAACSLPLLRAIGGHQGFLPLATEFPDRCCCRRCCCRCGDFLEKI